ncbi:MAG: hypothetical protein LBT62_02370, partial [Deltaproteobacteria bacterium]|nr:hypothetical protein [Deltaproteobacteria bacterium]
WLVNALAEEVIENILACDYSAPITAQHMDQAADNLMNNRRSTHLDHLLTSLSKKRVRRFIDPMLSVIRCCRYRRTRPFTSGTMKLYFHSKTISDIVLIWDFLKKMADFGRPTRFTPAP